MSEERKLILQMVAEGKITADEADKLLQALEESGRQAESTATERVQRDAAEKTATPTSLGGIIEKAVEESLRGLEDSLRDMEINLERRLNDPARDQLFTSIEESMRKSAERAVERANRMEERAARAAERASRRAEEIAQRAREKAALHAERVSQRLEHAGHGREPKATILKTGICIDRVQIERSLTLAEKVQPGDRFVLDNRVGNIRAELYEGDTLEVTVRQQVWGEDEADANARADVTKVSLERTGSDVRLVVDRPTINAVGVIVLKDTRHDFTIRVPQDMHLDMSARAGDIVVVAGDKVATLNLSTKVGDVDVKVGHGAEFSYQLTALTGRAHTQLSALHAHEEREAMKRGDMLTGRIGLGGGGRIDITTKAGDIRIVN